MSEKLYIKRGGAGSIETEVMDMVTTRKGAPVFEGDTPIIDMGRRFADGEASQGTFRLVDPAAEIHSTSYRLSPHALVTWTEDASGDELWLARSRIAPLESGRRGYGVGGDEVEWEVTANDNNIDLRGQHFKEAWVRPAETDNARIIALQAYTLNGSSSTAARHRYSCNITCSTSHLMSTAFTRNMPAHTYPAGTTPQEVIADCAERAGKVYGVVIHHSGGTSHDCLLYKGPLDHVTYATTVKVSDHIADADIDDPSAPVFPPIWDRGKGTLTENDDVLSALVLVYDGPNNDPKSVWVDQPGDETPYEYWTDVVFDDKVEDRTEAVNLAEQILEAHRAPGHRTHRFSIKLHTSQHVLLNAGMSMQVKSAVIAGGADLGTYVWRTISELRWEPDPDPEWIWAHIDLEKPLRRRGSSGQPASTTPTGPPPGTPGTPPVACTEIASYNWQYDSDTMSTGSGSYSWADFWNDGSWARYGGLFDGGFGWCGISNDTVFEASKHAIEPGFQVELTLDANNRGSHDLSASQYVVLWYTAAGATGELVSIVPILTVAAVNAVNTYTGTLTAPDGAHGFSVRMPRQIGQDNVTLRVLDCSAATPGTDPIPSTAGPTTVGGSGDWGYSDSDQFVPVGSTLEHLYITEGGPYHDADQIAIDDTGDIFVATDVEGALQELALGIRSYHDYGDLGATEVFDIRDGNTLEGTLTTDCDITFTGITAGVGMVWRVHIIGDGASDVTFPDVLWPDNTAPVIDVTSGSHWFEFISVDGGTTVFGDYGGQTATFSLTVKDEGTPLATDATSLDFVGSGVVASGTGAAKTITISGAPTGAAGGDLSGTYPNPSVVDDSHSHTSATLPATTSGTDHVHIVDEQFSGDASATVFDLANEAVPETAIAYVAGTRTSVTVSGTMNDQITFGSAPASGTNNISVDYVAVAS